MMPNRVNRIGLFVGLFFLLLLIAALVGSLVIGLFEGGIFGAPLLALFLVPFILFDLWPLLLCFSIWLTWFPPKRPSGWCTLLLFALVGGVIASWRFQIVGPLDFHHGDEIKHGSEVVHMASMTTWMTCFTAVASVVLAHVVFQRRERGKGRMRIRSH
jgi:hypothetical protein